MSTDRKRPIVDWPGYWFLILEKSLAGGDLDSAAEARRQLSRLGVEVVFCCAADGKGAGNVRNG